MARQKPSSISECNVRLVWLLEQLDLALKPLVFRLGIIIDTDRRSAKLADREDHCKAMFDVALEYFEWKQFHADNMPWLWNVYFFANREGRGKLLSADCFDPQGSICRELVKKALSLRVAPDSKDPFWPYLNADGSKFGSPERFITDCLELIWQFEKAWFVIQPLLDFNAAITDQYPSIDRCRAALVNKSYIEAVEKSVDHFTAVVVEQPPAMASTRKNAGRLPKDESEAKHAHFLALVTAHPTLQDDPAKLAATVGISERHMRRWLDKLFEKYAANQNRRMPEK